MAFNDGEPLDAAKLGDLELKLNNLSASIPKIGASTTSVTINQALNQTVTVPQIYGGRSDKITLPSATITNFTVDYSAAKLSGTPKALVFTPNHSSNKSYLQPYIISMDSSKAQCAVYNPGTSSMASYFYYIVISHA